jgi:hypothetical protein
MKPTLEMHDQCDSITLAAQTSPVFPKPDFNCRATTRADLQNLCAGCFRSSFRAISEDYFANEAPQYFAYEAALFFIMILTVALPLLNASAAVLELIRIG